MQSIVTEGKKKWGLITHINKNHVYVQHEAMCVPKFSAGVGGQWFVEKPALLVANQKSWHNFQNGVLVDFCQPLQFQRWRLMISLCWYNLADSFLSVVDAVLIVGALSSPKHFVGGWIWIMTQVLQRHPPNTRKSTIFWMFTMYLFKSLSSINTGDLPFWYLFT